MLAQQISLSRLKLRMLNSNVLMKSDVSRIGRNIQHDFVSVIVYSGMCFNTFYAFVTVSDLKESPTQQFSFNGSFRHFYLGMLPLVCWWLTNLQPRSSTRR